MFDRSTFCNLRAGLKFDFSIGIGTALAWHDAVQHCMAWQSIPFEAIWAWISASAASNVHIKSANLLSMNDNTMIDSLFLF
jgi:hypothetical protein